MRQLIHTHLYDLERARQLLSINLPRQHRVAQQHAAQLRGGTANRQSNQLCALYRASSHRSRGLGLMWWAPLTSKTLLLDTVFKQYDMGFDERIFLWKGAYPLRLNAATWGPTRTTLRTLTAPVWQSAPLMRELGTWGGASAHRDLHWLGAYASTGWSAVWRVRVAPVRPAWWKFRPATLLVALWSLQLGGLPYGQLPQPLQAEAPAPWLGLNSLALPHLTPVDAEEITPQVTALLWHEVFDTSSLVLHAFERWGLEAGAPRYSLPRRLVLHATLALVDEFLGQTLPVWEESALCATAALQLYAQERDGGCLNWQTPLQPPFLPALTLSLLAS